MSNRYEREIEEILRNLESNEPRSIRGQKFGERVRRQAGQRSSGRGLPSLHFSPPEWLLILSIGIALLAGGYAYLLGADIFTGVAAGLSIICLFLVALSQFSIGQRRVQSTRYGNVTITPLRRNPFYALKTQWNLLMLKLRYRNKNKT
jgi:hypothetical protein